MIVVTVEIWPFGEEAKKRTLEQLYIANTADCAARPILGNYDFHGTCSVFDEDGKVTEEPVKGRIENHFRGQTAWALVKKALDKILSE